jgi:hypothetical protein
MRDFVWWSGLTVADARAGIALAGRALDHQLVEGDDYWFDAESGPACKPATVAHLLPNFDEYTVAYRDRTAAVHTDRPFEPSLFSFGSILSNVVIVEGRVRGSGAERSCVAACGSKSTCSTDWTLQRWPLSKRLADDWGSSLTVMHSSAGAEPPSGEGGDKVMRRDRRGSHRPGETRQGRPAHRRVRQGGVPRWAVDWPP